MVVVVAVVGVGGGGGGREGGRGGGGGGEQSDLGHFVPLISAIFCLAKCIVQYSTC